MTMALGEATTLTNLASKSVGIFSETQSNRAAAKTVEKLAADAMAQFQRTQGERWTQERQWYVNLAFYYGQHYVQFRNDYHNRRFDMYVPPAPYYRVRPVINQIRKVVRKELSRLTAQQPNAYIIPASMDDRDIFAAQAGEQIWSSMWRAKNFNRVVRQATFWQATCGNAFIKQWWDQYAYDKDNKTYGDIAIKSETPFHIYVCDLRSENLEDQPFMIHAQVRNRQWLKQQFGIEISDADLSEVEDSLLTVMGLTGQDKKSNAIVLEFWVKPGYFTELPEGGMFTMANRKIIQGWDQWPYEHGEYPFSKLDGIPTGKFYNASIIEDLIPIQRELNRTRGQIIEAKNRMAKPQLLAEEGSVNPSKITSEPGQVITYKIGSNPPTPLPMQDMPAYVREEVDRLYTDIADMSGQHEVSQGQTPPGVTAAVAISYLQEQDESLISTHFDSLEEAIEKTARQTLSYVHTYWDEERTIKITGIDSTFDVQTFKGSDLNGNTDIRVESGSALPTSRAAKQAFITDLMKMGFIDPQEGLEVMEIGGLNKIYERVQVDIRQAQRENLKMRIVTEEDVITHLQAYMERPEEERMDKATGMPFQPPLIIPVNSYDNHEIHIDQHNRYRKSQAFEMASPLTKRLFEEHVNEHMQALMTTMQATQAMGTNPLQPPEAAGPESQLQEQQPPPPPGGMM
jgi:hypothetical protein